MSSLAERLKEALAHREMSGQGLEQEAKLSKGYASRLTSGKRGVRTNPEMLRRIAGVLDVSYEWLATGHGSMEDRGPLRGDVERYPNRAAAIRYWPERWSAATLAAARAIVLSPDEDVSPQLWTEKLDQIESALRPVLADIVAEEAPAKPGLGSGARRRRA